MHTVPKTKSRRLALLACVVFILAQLFVARHSIVQARPPNSAEASLLFANFVNPPREYSVTPYWWWNGKLVGTKVWEPYRFDLTPFARAGAKDLKIVVTNTMSNGTDVRERFRLLNNIDPDGLLGPVRIVPEVRVEVNCARQ